MVPSLGQFLNRTVLISIPALFGDGACRPYTLRGAELHGLWLQSDDLNGRLLLPDDDSGERPQTREARHVAAAEPVVFVPFAQIAAVMVPTAAPAGLPPGAEQAPAAGPPATGKQTGGPARRPAGERRARQRQGLGKDRPAKP
jgi:hypothetical protein